MSSYQGNHVPYDPAAQPVWTGAPAAQLPQAPTLGPGYVQQPPLAPQPAGNPFGAQQPQVVAPQFFNIAPAPSQPPYMATDVIYAAPAVPAASVWQPRYVPSAPAPSSSFVPPLVRRDGVFGLAVGLLLIVLIFATALALQARMPGYAPATSGYARPAAAVANVQPAVGPTAAPNTG